MSNNSKRWAVQALQDFDEATELCNIAIYSIDTYMRAIGKAARLNRDVAIGQVENDLRMSGRAGITVAWLDAFMHKCIRLSMLDPETGRPIPYATGKSSDDNSSCYTWAVFFRVDIPKCIDVEDSDLAKELTGWRSSYGCPGQYFRDAPFVQISRTRILVKQFGGYDI